MLSHSYMEERYVDGKKGCYSIRAAASAKLTTYLPADVPEGGRRQCAPPLVTCRRMVSIGLASLRATTASPPTFYQARDAYSTALKRNPPANCNTISALRSHSWTSGIFARSFIASALFYHLLRTCCVVSRPSYGVERRAALSWRESARC